MINYRTIKITTLKFINYKGNLRGSFNYSPKKKMYRSTSDHLLHKRIEVVNNKVDRPNAVFHELANSFL